MPSESLSFFPLASVTQLREAGHDIVAVGQISPGAKDAVVMAYAVQEARLVLTDTWGGSIRTSIGEFRQLARDGTSSRVEAMAQIAEAWT